MGEFEMTFAMDTSMSIRKEHTYGMWLKLHKQTERESYSHRRGTKVTVVQRIYPRTNKTKNKKLSSEY